MTIQFQNPSPPPRRRGDPLTARAWVALEQRLRRLHREDRGDVPGWVLVTLMTAGLVTALWLVAGTALTDVFSNAIKSVKP